MDIINIYENFNSYFNADNNLKAIFEQCSKIASKSRHKIYLIGGLVRDMLLDKPSLDVDITVEGDAIEFARILEQNGAKILSLHQNFGTAKIEIQGQKIDLASTRSEFYPKKGHLPVIQEIGCSLEKDVSRRDFTINSLAMSLNKDSFADLIDYVGGFNDLKLKKIRVLHNNSFIDDPTRIIRGLKYASRLGFELEEKTLKLQEEYLKNINYDMGIKRIKQEFKKTFEDCQKGTFDKFLIQRHAELISASFQYSQLDRFQIKFEMTLGCYLEELIKKYKPKHPWLVHFGVIIINEDISRYDLTKTEKEIIEGAKCLLNKELKNDFESYKAFCALRLETLLILASLGKEKEVLHYLNDLAKIKILLTGKDLIKIGLKPSKDFGAAFDFVLKAKLKNPELTKSDELKTIKNYFKI